MTHGKIITPVSRVAHTPGGAGINKGKAAEVAAAYQGSPKAKMTGVQTGGIAKVVSPVPTTRKPL